MFTSSIRFLFTGAYALSCFFVFALHAKTLDAPMLSLKQEQDQDLLSRSQLEAKPKTIEHAIRGYLVKQMPGISINKASRLAKLLIKLSQKHKLPPGLLLSVIRVESNFQPWAVSSQGALGLMQIMPETGQWLSSRLGLEWKGPASLFDEETNITLGVEYLAYLRQKYEGDIKKVLMAYNRGPARVDEEVAEGKELVLSYYHKVKYFLPQMATAIQRGPSGSYVD